MNHTAEHYEQDALDALDRAHSCTPDGPDAGYYAGRAQVYATLALAAAVEQMREAAA